MSAKLRKINRVKTAIPQGCQESVNYMTYYPWFLKLLENSHPEAAKIFTYKHKEYCERTFGGKWQFKRAQYNALFKNFGNFRDAFDRDIYHHLAYNWIRDGFRFEDTQAEQGLEILSKLLDTTHPVVK